MGWREGGREEGRERDWRRGGCDVSLTSFQNNSHLLWLGSSSFSLLGGWGSVETSNVQHQQGAGVVMGEKSGDQVA